MKTEITELAENGFQADASDRTLTTHAKVFAAGEKYDIPGLKDLAQFDFKRFLYSGEGAVQDVAEALRVVYTTTPDTVRELREIVVERFLIPGNVVIEDADIEIAVESIDKLAYELFKKTQAESRNCTYRHVRDCTCKHCRTCCNTRYAE